MSERFLCDAWQERDERRKVGGVSFESRIGASARKGCVVIGSTTKASNNRVPPPPVSSHVDAQSRSAQVAHFLSFSTLGVTCSMDPNPTVAIHYRDYTPPPRRFVNHARSTILSHLLRTHHRFPCSWWADWWVSDWARCTCTVRMVALAARTQIATLRKGGRRRRPSFVPQFLRSRSSRLSPCSRAGPRRH